MKSRSSFVIGSRGSRLALWQSEWIKARLGDLYTHLEIRIEIIKTTGDVLKQAPLAIIGGRGVFTKELEEALLNRRIDLAVHSLKDLPTTQLQGLVLAAITEREDPRDALVVRRGLAIEDVSIAGLPLGAVVGTSSPRRLAQLKHLRPDLSIKDIRGNVDTRLSKIDAGDYDAGILAAAGLRRLGFTDRISSVIEPGAMLPAVGQGALGIETRADDPEIINLLQPLNHQATRTACLAERALLRRLGGGCQLPIAGHAVTSENRLHLEGLVSSVSGDVVFRDRIEGAAAHAEGLGETLGAQLLERGAAQLLHTPVL